jgi:hypothetical protein
VEAPVEVDEVGLVFSANAFNLLTEEGAADSIEQVSGDSCSHVICSQAMVAQHHIKEKQKKQRSQQQQQHVKHLPDDTASRKRVDADADEELAGGFTVGIVQIAFRTRTQHIKLTARLDLTAIRIFFFHARVDNCFRFQKN